MKPEIPQKSPYLIQMEPGNYAWCQCGKSGNQPFCDGAHSGTGMEPLMEKITEKKQVAWCGCKHTNQGPYCDGSHSKL